MTYLTYFHILSTDKSNDICKMKEYLPSGKTCYGIIDDSEVKIDDVKKELPEDMTDIVEIEPMEDFSQIPSVAEDLIDNNDDNRQCYRFVS